jgi:hypothetical protein
MKWHVLNNIYDNLPEDNDAVLVIDRNGAIRLCLWRNELKIFEFASSKTRRIKLENARYWTEFDFGE